MSRGHGARRSAPRSAEATRAARHGGLALALAAALLIAPGCVSVPLGPPVAPPIYPDRTSVDTTWQSFLYAWKTGDIDVLLQTTGWRAHARLRKQLEAQTREEVAAYYRDEDLRVVEAEWTVRGDELAYLRAVLHSSRVDRVEVEFSFVERPDGWVLTQQRKLR